MSLFSLKLGRWSSTCEGAWDSALGMCHHSPPCPGSSISVLCHTGCCELLLDLLPVRCFISPKLLAMGCVFEVLEVPGPGHCTDLSLGVLVLWHRHGPGSCAGFVAWITRCLVLSRDSCRQCCCWKWLQRGMVVFPACSSQGTSSAMNLTTVDLIVYSSNTRPIYKSFHPISFYLIWMFRCQSK